MMLPSASLSKDYSRYLVLTLVEQIILSVHDNTSSNHDVPQRLTTAVCTEKKT